MRCFGDDNEDESGRRRAGDKKIILAIKYIFQN